MSQVIIDLPSHISSDEARLLLSIKLYEDKRISLGKAAELAGYSKRAFMDVLSQKEIPVINISPDDLDREVFEYAQRTCRIVLTDGADLFSRVEDWQHHGVLLLTTLRAPAGRIIRDGARRVDTSPPVGVEHSVFYGPTNP